MVKLRFVKQLQASSYPIMALIYKPILVLQRGKVWAKTHPRLSTELQFQIVYGV
jgi:hypothetical protein